MADYNLDIAILLTEPPLNLSLEQAENPLVQAKFIKALGIETSLADVNIDQVNNAFGGSLDNVDETFFNTINNGDESSVEMGNPELAAYLVAEFGVTEQAAIEADTQKMYLQAEENGDLTPFLMGFTNYLQGVEDSITSFYQYTGGSTGDGDIFQTFSQNMAAMDVISAFDQQYAGLMNFGAMNSPFASQIQSLNMSAQAQFMSEYYQVADAMGEQFQLGMGSQYPMMNQYQYPNFYMGM